PVRTPFFGGPILGEACLPVTDRERMGSMRDRYRAMLGQRVRVRRAPLGDCTMEMQQVRYFVALAGTLNFTRAAEQCNVSQPALTRAIQQLEHELGGPLFHRERGNTHLSELGRMMLPYLQTVEEQTKAAREQAKAVKRLEKATLTIGTMCTIGPQLVSSLMIRFQAAHPDVEVRVVDAGAPQMIEMLEKGELEVAIVGVPGELPESLHQLPVFQERFVI